MPRPFALSILLAALAGCFECCGDDTFTWKLAPGDVVEWNFEQVATTTIAPPNRDKQTMTQSVKVHYRGVVETVDAKHVEIKVTTPRAALKMASPAEPPIDVDSAVEPEDEFGKAFKTMLDVFLEVEYAVTIDQRGNAIELDIDPELLKRLKEARHSRPTASALSTQGFNSLFLGGWLGFPDGSIKPETKWSLTLPVLSMDREGIGQKYVQTVAYVGKETLNAKELDKFHVALHIDLDKVGEGIVKAFENQMSSGVAYFDRSTGRMVRSEITWEATPQLKVEIPGQHSMKIVSTTIFKEPSSGDNDLPNR